ncbi:MAG TPA: hypothetical protein VKP66_15465 [Steroidobacteraceae bacterium]|nr:hypothetical protein [Steroidobacteraceae bacterium]
MPTRDPQPIHKKFQIKGPKMNIISRWLPVLALLSPVVANSQSYTFTDLGTLGGSESIANGINNGGQVVGWSYDTNGVETATLWNGTTPTALTTLGGPWGNATGINDNGQIVGESATNGSGPSVHATLWNNVTPTDLGAPTGSTSSASAINNVGQIVGYSNGVNGSALLWNGTTAIALGSPSGAYSAAIGINLAGQVVGYSNDQPVLWNGTIPTPLGTLGGQAYATGINNSGKVVGWGFSSSNGVLSSLAISWNGTTPTALGTLGGATSEASGINNAGQIVGFSTTPSSTDHVIATIWNGTTATDLNTLVNLPTGFTLIDATAINDKGQIVGYGWNNLKQVRAFLLTPISLPGALLANLLKEVTGVGPGKSLANDIELMQAYYAANDVQAACAVLTGFVNEVKAQNGKKIGPTSDAQIISDAHALEVALGCN